MRSALALAVRGHGSVAPNPAVGCVIAAPDGRVISRGWTAPGGRPHAETQALERAGNRASGARVYVTLEPCAHHGRTPPCADALVAAGVGACFVAASDPDPRVNGQGLAKLRAAGIETHLGLCREEAEDLNAGFLMKQRFGRPLVTVKLAASLDGRIACANGHSRWVTGDMARRHVHLLRASHDAIMVGSGTALADDPRLDVRLDGLEGRGPLRVLLDSDARVPLGHDLVRRAQEQPTVLLAAEDLQARKLDALEGAGVKIRRFGRDKEGHLDLNEVLEVIAGLGVTRLLVEGGGGLAAALLRKDLIDRIVWYGAPILAGGDGLAALGPLGLTAIDQAPRFERHGMVFLGDDLMLAFERTSKLWRSV